MVELTYFGHSSLKITKGSTRLYIDPWFNSPSFPSNETRKIENNSFILVSHGHFDHFETAHEVAQKQQVKVVINFDLMLWLTMHGVAEDKIIPLNKGGTALLSDNIDVSMVPAEHSSTVAYENQLYPGGEPAGYIIKCSDDVVIYYAGDTSVFGDMSLITEFYKPTIAILPVGGLFTMSGKQVAYALDNLLTSVKTVIPTHYGTFDFLSGTPEEVQKNIKRRDVEFNILKPGDKIKF